MAPSILKIWRLLVLLVVLASSRGGLGQNLTLIAGPTYGPGIDGYLVQGLPAQRNRNINDAGVAAPWTTLYDDGQRMGIRGIRLSSTGAPWQELATLSLDSRGRSSVFPLAINAAGVIIGNADRYFDDLTYSYAVRWDAGGTQITELAVLGNDPNVPTGSSARGINNYGTIVGAARPTPDRGYRPVRWDAGGSVITELGILGTSPSGVAFSYAQLINDTGVIAGYVQQYSQTGRHEGERIVRWDPNSTQPIVLTAPGELVSPFNSSGPTDITNAGVILGNVRIARDDDPSANFAVRWAPNQTVGSILKQIGTPSPGTPTGTGATDINESGTVVGAAHKHDGLGNDLGFVAVRWESNSDLPIELAHGPPDANGFEGSVPVAINDWGLIVGNKHVFNSAGVVVDTRAVCWLPGGNTVIDLNSFIEQGSGWTLTECHSISNTGWIHGVGLFDPDGPGGREAYERLYLTQITGVVPEPGMTASIALAAVVLMRHRRRRALPGYCLS